MKARAWVLVVVATLFSAPAFAQAKNRAARRSPTPAETAAPADRAATPAAEEANVSRTPTPAEGAPCSAAEYHQFDFWVGDWNVVGADGKPAGEDRVVSAVKGCALQENWSSAKGAKAASLSIYDATTKHWNQTWVDDSGGNLQLEGEFHDGSMVLLGRHRSQKSRGTWITHRITWTPTADRVRQLWEASSNEGRTWQIVFEGTYVRKR